MALPFPGLLFYQLLDKLKSDSTLVYNPPQPYKWGYEIEGDVNRYEWFKLGLSKSHNVSGLSLRYPSRSALPIPTGDKCEELITDYLQGVCGYVNRYLKETLGTTVVKNNKLDYIITVPAVWSPKAQDTTRDCAEKAGMGSKHDIQIITEPEAASIFAFDTIKLSLDVGDTFVMCDAGGG